MGESKFVNFFKRNSFMIKIVAWPFVIGLSFSILNTADISWVTRTLLIVFMIVYTILSCFWFVKGILSYVDKEQEEKLDKINSLKLKYESIISLVSEKVQEEVDFLHLGENLKEYFFLENEYEYLIDLDRQINWVCKNRIVGKPDTFIIASCLLYAIIDNPIVFIDSRIQNVDNDDIDVDWDDFAHNININIVLNCVFELISEPITYYREGEEWLSKDHPKVKIDVPKGIIDNSPLSGRIINTISRDEKDDIRASIMQMSNLLHMIYLSSSETAEESTL